jgi:hypothetical protein
LLWPWTTILLISASWVVRITCMSHWCQFFFLSFFVVLVWTQSLHLEPLHQHPPFSLWRVFFEIGSLTLFVWASFYHDPPDFCLLSS